LEILAILLGIEVGTEEFEDLLLELIRRWNRAFTGFGMRSEIF